MMELQNNSDFSSDQLDRWHWEMHQVSLNREAGYGFGIAVSGGRDNPHFSNGDPSIAISDVLKAGPAEGKLQVNDRIISANGVSLEGVEYATAVQVLRDSGNTVQLVVKRRTYTSTTPEPQTIKIQITKNRKKDDFGVVLGNRIFVKHTGAKLEGNTLQEGDILLKINNHLTDGMSLKDARKMIECTKETLNLVVRREARNSFPPEPTVHSSKDTVYMESNNLNCIAQNLYVQPPTRSPLSSLDDKSNLVPRGRSRGPVMDLGLMSLDRSSSPVGHSHSRNVNLPEDLSEPPRPPPPRQDYYNSRHYDDDPLQQKAKQAVPEKRLISFMKEGSVGIRLTGGNEVGIFVTAVQPGSPASLQGLQPGNKILKVNDMDLKGVTREEAVLLLLSLQDQIQLVVQQRRDEYDHVVASQRGDSFHIKAHFNYDQPNKGEMSFHKGDIFHVVDTLHNGVVGAWQVYKIGRNNKEIQKGIIPNKARAEELATAQFNANKKEASVSESRGSFFRRRRSSHRRSKSLSKDHWDDVVFGDGVSKFPAYERVVLRHPGFMRPVVLFGPLADIAREKMLKDFPEKFSSPHLENNMEEVSKSSKTSGIIRLSAIRDIMDRGKHSLLDITPNAVDRLNYAQFYPLVIFLRAESKHVVKELRAGISKTGHKSSRKLFEQSQKVEKAWNHVFTAIVQLSSAESWYRKVRELIDKHQSSPVWMSESKPEETLSDDFLFPMGSLRLSYASSPESDLEATPGSLGNTMRGSPRLVKCSSDPSIATQPENSPKLQHSSYLPNHSHSNQQFESSNKARISVDMFTGLPPELPPRIDRGVKPSRTNGSSPRSAQERLFGGEPPNYINANIANNQSSLDRQDTNKSQNSFDSMSSYDCYTQKSSGNQNSTDESVLSNGGIMSSHRSSAHDPYRFTRSTQQPMKAHEMSPRNKSIDYSKFRSQGVVDYSPSKNVPMDYSQNKNVPMDYSQSKNVTLDYTPTKNSMDYTPTKNVSIDYSQNKNLSMDYSQSKNVSLEYSQNKNVSMDYSQNKNVSMEYTPTKNPMDYNNPNKNSSIKSPSQTYKPIPPPKPKNYRPPHQNYYPNNNGYHSKSYSMAENSYSSHLHNGVGTGTNMNSQDIDVNGHNSLNSSLDKNSYGRSGHQYYYNILPSPRQGHPRESSALDLVHRADQRGSAFELYKKPSDSNNSHYLDQSFR